jgi:multicomponent Na+:H+ antiporter subunit B
MKDQIIPRISVKILIPPILLFGFYVHFHGDYGPGGAFQAGVILAAGIVLYALIFGLQEAKRVCPMPFTIAMGAIGYMVFAGTGLLSVLLGGNALDYNLLSHDPVAGQHLGIIIIEAGVVSTVFGAIVTLFYAFAGRRRISR